MLARSRAELSSAVRGRRLRTKRRRALIKRRARFGGASLGSRALDLRSFGPRESRVTEQMDEARASVTRSTTAIFYRDTSERLSRAYSRCLTDDNVRSPLIRSDIHYISYDPLSRPILYSRRECGRSFICVISAFLRLAYVLCTVIRARARAHAKERESSLVLAPVL